MLASRHVHMSVSTRAAIKKQHIQTTLPYVSAVFLRIRKSIQHTDVKHLKFVNRHEYCALNLLTLKMIHNGAWGR